MSQSKNSGTNDPIMGHFNGKLVEPGSGMATSGGKAKPRGGKAKSGSAKAKPHQRQAKWGGVWTKPSDDVIVTLNADPRRVRYSVEIRSDAFCQDLWLGTDKELTYEEGKCIERTIKALPDVGKCLEYYLVEAVPDLVSLFKRWEGFARRPVEVIVDDFRAILLAFRSVDDGLAEREFDTRDVFLDKDFDPRKR